MRKLSVLVAAAVLLSGCSWIFQQRLDGGIDRYEASKPPQCGGLFWPVVDTVWTGLFVERTIVNAASGDYNNAEKTKLVLAGIALAAVHIGAAAFGYRRASECREANALWAASERGLSAPEEVERERLAALLRSDKDNEFAKVSSYWCSRTSGACQLQRAACLGDCEERRAAWCAGVNLDEQRPLVCAVSREHCIEGVNKAGDRNPEDCVERTAELPSAPSPAAVSAPAPVQAAPVLLQTPPGGH